MSTLNYLKDVAMLSKLPCLALVAGSLVVTTIGCSDDDNVNAAPQPRLEVTGPVTLDVSDEESALFVVPGTAVMLSGAGSFDYQGEDLTFEWTLVAPEGSSAALSSTTGPEASFTPDVVGSYEVTLVVSDGEEGANASATVIARENMPPTANAGEDQVVAEGQTVQLDASASADAAESDAPTVDDALTYEWTLTDPAGNDISEDSLSSVMAARPSFDATMVGVYTATVKVTDPFGATATDEVSITVRANEAPIADVVKTAQGSVGMPIILDGSASSDPDGDTLEYTWLVIDSQGVNVTEQLTNADTAQPTFTATEAGVYEATLRVSDGFATSEPETIRIDVM